MNEAGELNLNRFEIYITELAKFDHQRYSNENDTFKHLNKLTGRHRDGSKKKTEDVKNINQAEDTDEDIDCGFAVFDKLTVTTSPTTTQKFDPKNEVSSTVVSTESKFANTRLSSSSSSSSSDDDDNDNDDTLPSDSDIPSDKLNDGKKKNILINDDDLDNLPLIEAEFRQHKNHYYRNKMKIDLQSTAQIKVYVEQYIEALQWILKYYYQGCPSWSWFYPHHYAPYLSDLKCFKDMKIIFSQGTPFKPFEQLLSMLFQFKHHRLFSKC